MENNKSPKCDIVIPVWNHPEMTKDCIESIAKHTRFPYRIVIVDNASDEPTRNYLDSIGKETSDRVVIIRNKENTGFVKAVNQGMRYSDAEYICIMNNDTLATDGWLTEMIEIAAANDDIGVINPSSNTSCQFPGEMSIDDYAETLKKFKGDYQELYTCRAFAMVLKKEVKEKAGYLDEDYGMGYYDDTDYCKRAQELGLRTVRAKASYVYHKESQSFSKIKEKSEIFSENEKKFIAKWGRQLRVAYVLPSVSSEAESKKISSNINKLAKIGHQVWIFTTRGTESKLKLIDHENIRFYYYPAFLFAAIVLYKLWKRKKKKKMHLILTNDKMCRACYSRFAFIPGAETFKDDDFTFLENKLNSASHDKKI